MGAELAKLIFLLFLALIAIEIFGNFPVTTTVLRKLSLMNEEKSGKDEDNATESGADEGSGA